MILVCFVPEIGGLPFPPKIKINVHFGLRPADSRTRFVLPLLP